jgi:hypothetical protein
MVWKGLLLQHRASLLPLLSGFRHICFFDDFYFLKLNLQPGRVTKEAAGRLSIIAAWVLLGQPRVTHGANVFSFCCFL